MKASKERNYAAIAGAELHPCRGAAGIPASRLLHCEKKRGWRMGGRGASSGFYKLNGVRNAYGDEYTSVISPLGNIKIVARRDGKPAKAPTESMTLGRIYATVDGKTGKLNSLSYMDGRGKVYKQLDYKDHKGLGSHVHEIRYNENGSIIRDEPRKLSRKERRTAEVVRSYVRRKGGAG